MTKGGEGGGQKMAIPLNCFFRLFPECPSFPPFPQLFRPFPLPFILSPIRVHSFGISPISLRMVIIQSRPVPEERASPNSAKLKENEKEEAVTFPSGHCRHLVELGEECGRHQSSLPDCPLPSSSSAASSSSPQECCSSRSSTSLAQQSQRQDEPEEEEEEEELELDVEGDGEGEGEGPLKVELAAEGQKGTKQIVEKRHKCEQCGKRFPYFSILEAHKRCHTGEKPFCCHFCDKRFAQKATLQVHERTHTGERPYKCKYCEKTFAQYGTKTVHEKSAHLGIRNYKCPHCAKSLSSPSALYTHKKTHGEKCFQCPCCPKTFTLKNYLKLHVRQVHQQTERKHCCRFCPKSFAYAGSLQVHLRTHTGERPYQCRYCPKAFASQGNLQSHERTHTGERPYSCGQCGRAFIQKSQLTAHEGTHANRNSNGEGANSGLNGGGKKSKKQRKKSGQGAIGGEMDNGNGQNDERPPLEQPIAQPIPIQLAPPAFDPGQIMLHPSSPFSSTPNSLNLAQFAPSNEFHQNSSLAIQRKQQPNGGSNSADFVCKFCGKRYAYASSLYVHTRLHTGERPFKCNFCEKSFTNQGNMQVHLRVHTGERPFKCEACGKSYAQKIGLKIHLEQCQIWLNRRGSIGTTSSSIGGNEEGEGMAEELATIFEEAPCAVNGEQRQGELALRNARVGGAGGMHQMLLVPSAGDIGGHFVPNSSLPNEFTHLLANPPSLLAPGSVLAINSFGPNPGPSNSLFLPPSPPPPISSLLLDHQVNAAIRSLLLDLPPNPPPPLFLPPSAIPPPLPLHHQLIQQILSIPPPVSADQNAAIPLLQQFLQLGPIEEAKLSEALAAALSMPAHSSSSSSSSTSSAPHPPLMR